MLKLGFKFKVLSLNKNDTQKLSKQTKRYVKYLHKSWMALTGFIIASGKK